MRLKNPLREKFVKGGDNKTKNAAANRLAVVLEMKTIPRDQWVKWVEDHPDDPDADFLTRGMDAWKPKSSTAPAPASVRTREDYYQQAVCNTLKDYFRDHPDKKEWRGSLLALMRLMVSDPLNALIFKTERMAMSNRYLEGLQRAGLCTNEYDDRWGLLVWIFQREKLLKPYP